MKRAIAVIAVAVLMTSLATAQHKKQSTKAASAQSASVAAQLEQTERKWAQAEVKHDAGIIEPYFDDTFVQTNPDGSVSTRKEVLESIGKGDPTLKEVTVDDMKTQTYGDAAVIIGRYTEHRESNGKHTMTSGRFTDTYVKRDGQWKCVASHDSVAVKE